VPDYDDGSEPQRVLGFPVTRGEHGQSWRDRADASQHVLGLPTNWFGSRRAGRPRDTRWLSHPARWWRWRMQVRRLGPYAPDFDKIGPRTPHRPKHSY
jgi:hypothetical protein